MKMQSIKATVDRQVPDDSIFVSHKGGFVTWIEADREEEDDVVATICTVEESHYENGTASKLHLLPEEIVPLRNALNKLIQKGFHKERR